MGLVNLGDLLVDPWRIEFIIPRPHAREGSMIHFHSGSSAHTSLPALEAERLINADMERITREFEREREERDTRLAKTIDFPTPVSARDVVMRVEGDFSEADLAEHVEHAREAFRSTRGGFGFA